MKRIIAWVGILVMTASNSYGWGFGGGGGGGGNDDTLASYTVATLPAPTNGLMVYVSDGADATDCTTGSGATKVTCIGNGSGFVSVGVAGASTTSDAVYDVGTWNGDTTHSPSSNAVSDKIEAVVATIIPAATFNAHTVLYATTDNTPAALTVGEQTVVGRAAGGNIAAIAIDSDLSSVSASDDTVPSAKATKAVTDTLVTKALFGAHTVLAATTDDVPAALTITESTIVGRAPSGNIAAIGLGTGLTITEAGNLTIGTLNQNTTGTAANVSGTPALPDGTTATKQAKNDSSTKLATTSFVMSQTNTATSAGIVATGAGQVNKVWKTDADGIPGWSDDATGGTPTFDTVATGTNVSATMTAGTGSTVTYSGSGVVNASQFRGVTAVDATEFGYVDGVTSAIQTQLNAKAPSTSPTLVTPTLGVATATSINKVAVTAPATAATLTIADGKTLTASNTLTLAGTDSTVMTFPTTSATIARTDAANTFTGHQTIEGVTSTGATGTGAFVFATSPTLVTPTIGVATATSVNKVAITAPATSATLTIANGKTLTASNTLTFTATDGSTLAVGTGGTLGTAAYTAATAYQAANAALTSVSALSEAAGGMPYFTAANTWAALAGGASGNVMRYGASTAPTWSTLTMPDTIAAGSVFAANSANTLAAINSTSGTKFLQNADGTISWATGVGTIAGSTGSADNALITANGTGGSTIQANSATATLSDAGLLTVPTISAGAAGFTVDAVGNVVAKSFDITKTSGTAGATWWYEGNSTDKDFSGRIGPLTMTGNTSYVLRDPNARATSANMVLAYTNAGETGTGTNNSAGAADPYVQQGVWVDLDLYASLAGGATFTGKVTAPASTSSANGLNIGQGAACATSGTNGDLCITASGLYAWIGGSSVGPFSTGAPAFSDVTAGTNTAALIIGNSGSMSATGTGYFAGGADPADAGRIRLSNGAAEGILAEASAAGTDINVIHVDSGEIVQIGSAGASGVTITPATTITGAVTASTSVDTPFLIVGSAATAADAGAIRMPNAGYIYSEADAAGTDISVIGVDSSEVVQIGASGASGVTITPTTAISGGITVPTGQSVALAGTTYISGGADPADSGFVRMSNNTALAWEAATPGTDIFIALDSSEIFQVGQNAANITLGGPTKVTTALTPTAADGGTLGTTALEFSDLYLAAGGVIYGENGQENTITSSATGWNFNLPIGMYQANDPDVAAEGKMGWDANGDWLRVHDGTNQVAVARAKECYDATVVAPNDLADAVRDGFRMWQNNSGMNFIITSWVAQAGTDNTTLNLETTTNTGGTNATVDAVEIATDGTGLFYASDSTITAGTIATGGILWIDFDDTDTPTWVSVSVCGYYDGNVN